MDQERLDYADPEPDPPTPAPPWVRVLSLVAAAEFVFGGFAFALCR